MAGSGRALSAPRGWPQGCGCPVVSSAVGDDRRSSWALLGHGATLALALVAASGCGGGSGSTSSPAPSGSLFSLRVSAGKAGVVEELRVDRDGGAQLSYAPRPGGNDATHLRLPRPAVRRITAALD